MIYICIPTHDEQQTVGVVLWKLRQVFTEFPRDYQLLVADDASSDKTPEVLEPYTRVLPLTVIRCDRQLGFAASLEMLLREAVRRSEYPKRDVIVTLQADFSEEPDDLVPLIKRIEAGADVAVGNKVSKSRPSRMRRFARALASFFARGQKWPEGVETPFDGYRAYRLHALKHAMDEQSGRLLRYDGWAGHAELLRHVQKHARRVDVLDVVDRSDRLQRGSRERPIAAAMAVRSMSRGAEPHGLIPVEELDGIVATASSSRERGTLARQVAGNGRSRPAERGNGAGSRERGSRNAHGGSQSDSSGGRQGGGRDRNRTRGGRAQDATGDAPRRRQPRGSGADKAGTDAKSDQKPARPKQRSQPEPSAVAASPGTETPPPKKKRRRRRRGGGGGGGGGGGAVATGGGDAAANAGSESASTGTAGGNSESSGPGEGPQGSAPPAPTGAPSAPAAPAAGTTGALTGPATGEGAGEGTSDAEQGTGEQRKRRRRGGRRGGRGRRRKPGTQAEAGGEAVADAGESGDAGADRAGVATGDSAEPRPENRPETRPEGE